MGDPVPCARMGDGAQAVAALAWKGRERQMPVLITAPHPMIYGRGGAERLVVLSDSLRKAARLMRE
jgi:hypothetical protein